MDRLEQIKARVEGPYLDRPWGSVAQEAIIYLLARLWMAVKGIEL